jgi:hypothetical protein
LICFAVCVRGFFSRGLSRLGSLYLIFSADMGRLQPSCKSCLAARVISLAEVCSLNRGCSTPHLQHDYGFQIGAVTSNSLSV